MPEVPKVVRTSYCLRCQHSASGHVPSMPQSPLSRTRTYRAYFTLLSRTLIPRPSFGPDTTRLHFRSVFVWLVVACTQSPGGKIKAAIHSVLPLSSSSPGTRSAGCKGGLHPLSLRSTPRRTIEGSGEVKGIVGGG